MAPVLSMLSTIFVAVPAFMRVEPLTTSGPTTGAMLKSHRVAICGSRLQLRPMAICADALRVLEAAQHVRRAAARGDSDDDVAVGESDILQVFDRQLGPILGTFHSAL